MNILEYLKETISENSGTDKEEITTESHLREDLNLDTLGISDLISAVESKFDIKVSKDEIMKFIKISDIVEFIEDQIDES